MCEKLLKHTDAKVVGNLLYRNAFLDEDNT